MHPYTISIGMQELFLVFARFFDRGCPVFIYNHFAFKNSGREV